MKSNQKRLLLTVLKMSSLTAILRQVPASLQEPKWLQQALLLRKLLVKQYLLTLHLLMRLVSLQKQLLHSLPVKLIRRVGQLQLMKQLLLIGALKSHLGQATTQLLHRKHLPKVASSLLMIKATGII